MFRLNSEISIGNLLTSLSIIVALGTFFYNEFQKRAQIDRAYAADVRNQLGGVLREVAQMDAELRILFLSVEPLYVTTSEIALEGTPDTRERQTEKARDFLWREISRARTEMEKRILATSAQSNGLAIAGPALQADYEAFLKNHADLRIRAYASLSEETQAALQASAETAQYSAQIGNALRFVHYDIRDTWTAASDTATQAIRARIHTASGRYDPPGARGND